MNKFKIQMHFKYVGTLWDPLMPLINVKPCDTNIQYIQYFFDR